MPFPQAKRIIYKNNPLDEVVCQLRFPSILKIDAEIPAEFQESIRKQFPQYAESSEVTLDFPPMAADVNIPPQFLKPSETKNYEFTSEDGLWKINLTRTFLALTARKYIRWEEFRDKLNIPLKTLINYYKPTYFSRIGLRYIDVIKRSRLKLENHDWAELLKPFILGIIATPEVGNNTASFENKFKVKLSDNESFVRIITKYVEAQDGEICFMIDSDFFNTNKTDLTKAIDKLDYFHTLGSRLIQWCITDTLSKAMEPQEL